MAYSPELGMRVFDPREGAQIGLAAGRAFADAYQSAQDRELRERQLAGIEAENRRKAALLNLQQMGLAELRDEVSRGTPFEEALFKAGPKLFADKPEAIVSAIENRAKAEATKTYRESLLKLRGDAAKSLETHREQGRDIKFLERIAFSDALQANAQMPGPIERANENGARFHGISLNSAMTRNSPVTLRSMVNRRADIRASTDFRSSNARSLNAKRICSAMLSMFGFA